MIGQLFEALALLVALAMVAAAMLVGIVGVACLLIRKCGRGGA